MKLLWNDKDGGAASRVWCWGLESKRFGSILLLKFGEGSREAYHTHAFNSVSWVLKGELWEEKRLDEHHTSYGKHTPGIEPIRTLRETFHKVTGIAKESWVLTIRGSWADTWREFLPLTRRHVKLTHGRKEIDA